MKNLSIKVLTIFVLSLSFLDAGFTGYEKERRVRWNSKGRSPDACEHWSLERYSDSFAAQSIAPYSGSVVSEFFIKDNGKRIVRNPNNKNIKSFTRKPDGSVIIEMKGNKEIDGLFRTIIKPIENGLMVSRYMPFKDPDPSEPNGYALMNKRNETSLQFLPNGKCVPYMSMDLLSNRVYETIEARVKFFAPACAKMSSWKKGISNSSLFVKKGDALYAKINNSKSLRLSYAKYLTSRQDRTLLAFQLPAKYPSTMLSINRTEYMNGCSLRKYKQMFNYKSSLWDGVDLRKLPQTFSFPAGGTGSGGSFLRDGSVDR